MKLYLFIEGEVKFFIDRKLYTLQKGSLIFINNNQFHGTIHEPHVYPERSFKLCSINFSYELANYLLPQHTNSLDAFKKEIRIIQLNKEQFHIMSTSMNHLINEYISPSLTGHAVLLSSMLVQIIINADNFTNNSQKPLETKLLSKQIYFCLEYIHDHIQEPDLSLEKISDYLGNNKIYISRIFKQELNVTIYQYILSNRILLAKSLLQEGLSVQECCYTSGFNNYSNFIRTFRKNTGISPKQYSLTHMQPIKNC